MRLQLYIVWLNHLRLYTLPSLNTDRGEKWKTIKKKNVYKHAYRAYWPTPIAFRQLRQGSLLSFTAVNCKTSGTLLVIIFFTATRHETRLGCGYNLPRTRRRVLGASSSELHPRVLCCRGGGSASEASSPPHSIKVHLPRTPLPRHKAFVHIYEATCSPLCDPAAKVIHNNVFYIIRVLNKGGAAAGGGGRHEVAT